MDRMFESELGPTGENSRIGADHSAQVAQILAEVVQRRSAGEVLSDKEVLSAHPELAPRLAQGLRDIDRVEQAEIQAAERADEKPKSWYGQHVLPQHAIPGYKLIDEVHRGGQGVVYRALQLSTQRNVAIKVMRDGPFQSLRDVARFEREVRVLAKLKHPNIVTIHESGVAVGFRYFVMDFIIGEPPDSFVTSRGLSIQDVLRLIVRVCRAVNEAHLRGIIHRDLKPGNILVDSSAEPYILDFGLATLTADEIENADQWRELTVTGQFVGSLHWASPEQVQKSSSGQVDVRTDVYSLGLILHVLLTGEFPYSVDGDVRDVLTNIIETEPGKPSRIRKEIDPDLERIILKSLSKPAKLRYQSAGAMADDIERFLAKRPILAREPSKSYFLRKLVSRHKLVSCLSAIFALLITTSSILLAISNLRLQKHREELALLASQYQAVNDILVNMLGATNPYIAPNPNMTARQMLDNAAVQIMATPPDDPAAELSFHEVIGKSYLAIGITNEAVEHLEKALQLRVEHLGSRHAKTLETQLQLANALHSDRRFIEGVEMSRTALDGFNESLGSEHPKSAEAALQHILLLSALAPADALALVHKTRSDLERLWGADHPLTISAIRLTGTVYSALQQHGEAEQYYREVLVRSKRIWGAQHHQTISAMVDLGNSLNIQGRPADADPYLSEVLDHYQETLDEQHPAKLNAMANLALLRRNQGKLSDSTSLYRRALRISTTVRGKERPSTQRLALYLGTVLHRQGEYAEAAEVLGNLLAVRREYYGNNHLETASALNELGAVYWKVGLYAEAEELHREALNIHRSTRPEGHYDTLHSLQLLVRTLGIQNKIDEARPLARELLAGRIQLAQNNSDAAHLGRAARELLSVRVPDLQDPQQALSLILRAVEISPIEPSLHFFLGWAYRDTGDVDSAIDAFSRAVSLASVEHGIDRDNFEKALIELLDQTDQFQFAENVLRTTLAMRREALGPEHPSIAIALGNLGQWLGRHDRSTEAEELLRESLAMSIRTFPAHDWRIAKTERLLAEVLITAGDYGEAQKLLLSAIDRLNQRDIFPLDEKSQALKCLSQLDETWK